MWDEHNTRKPTLLFRLFGLFLLRMAERALAWLLFQDPPRSTRRSESSSSAQRPSLPSNRSRHNEQVHSYTLPDVSCRPNRFGGKLPTGADCSPSQGLPHPSQLAIARFAPCDSWRTSSPQG